MSAVPRGWPASWSHRDRALPATMTLPGPWSRQESSSARTMALVCLSTGTAPFLPVAEVLDADARDRLRRVRLAPRAPPAGPAVLTWPEYSPRGPGRFAAHGRLRALRFGDGNEI